MRNYFLAKPTLVRSILRIVIIYAVVSAVWVFTSDRLVGLIFRDPAVYTSVQTYKGWGFVVISSMMLFILLVNEENRRRKTEQALLDSQSSFQHLFAGNPSPMWVFDRDSLRFLEVNDAAVEKYGYSRDEFLQMAITDIRPEEDREALRKTVQSRPGSLHQAGVWKHITKDGRTLSVNIVTHSFEYSGASAILVIAEDVTKHTAIENAYQNAEQQRITAEYLFRKDESRLEALQRLSQTENVTPEKMIASVLIEAVQITSSSSGYFAMLDENGAINEVYFWPPRAEVSGSLPPNWGSGLLSPSYVLDQIAVRRVPIMVNHSADGQSVYPVIAMGFPFTRELVVPILEKSRIVGFAQVAGKAEDYDSADTRQLSLLMASVWRLIALARTVEKLRASQLRLQAAVDNLPFDFYMRDGTGRYILQNNISKRMWGDLIGKTDAELDLPPALRAVWDDVNRQLAAGETVQRDIVYPEREEMGAFYNIAAPISDDGEVLGTLGINVDISALKQRERELEAIATIASALRKTSTREKMLPIILDKIMAILGVDRSGLVGSIPDTQELFIELGRGQWSAYSGLRIGELSDETEKVLKSGEPFWTNDLNLLPELYRNDLFLEARGAACIPLMANEQVLGAIWVASRRELSDNDIKILKAITDIAASAINRAMLHEQTSRQLVRMTALRAVDMAISSTLDIRVTLDILLNQITTQVGVDAAIVLLYQPALQLLEYAAARGFHSRFPKNIHLRLGESIAGQVALDRKLRIIPDLRTVSGSISADLRKFEETFISYLAIPLIAQGQIKGVLELYYRNPQNPSNDWLDFVQAIASQAAIAIDNAELFDQVQRSNVELTLAYDATIEGWSRALELRDQETEGHTQRVTELTMKMIQALGISDQDAVHIRRGVLLHDIGKMGIPDSVLLKPGPLTEEEWKIMRKHPQYAYDLLWGIPYLRQSIDIPYNHHERWDGTGYPRGIGKENIPVPARLFSIVDNWDALTSDRPYRQAWPVDRVIEFINEEAGHRFDPDMVSFFLNQLHEETTKVA